MVSISLSDNDANARPSFTSRLEEMLEAPSFWLLPLAMVLAGVILVIPSFIQLVETGATYEHWSRFIAMSFLCSSALILVVTRAIDYVLQLVAERLVYLETKEEAVTYTYS